MLQVKSSLSLHNIRLTLPLTCRLLTCCLSDKRLKAKCKCNVIYDSTRLPQVLFFSENGSIYIVLISCRLFYIREAEKRKWRIGNYVGIYLGYFTEGTVNYFETQIETRKRRNSDCVLCKIQLVLSVLWMVLSWASKELERDGIAQRSGRLTSV